MAARTEMPDWLNVMQGGNGMHKGCRTSRYNLRPLFADIQAPVQKAQHMRIDIGCAESVSSSLTSVRHWSARFLNSGWGKSFSKISTRLDSKT